MGLGPPVLELYRQLKLLGAFEGVRDVMELGSQDFWCPQDNLVRALCAAFGMPEPPAELLGTTNAKQLPTRSLYQALGLNYHCVDVDGRSDTLVLDLNFDSVPAEHTSRYDLVTNHGTSEHLINQYNVFKAMHDLARPGALMVHAVPFTVHVDHGFFNYQPNFFEALGRYNSYETLGIWVGPDWQLPSFVPWTPGLLDFLTLSSKTTHLLVVAQRKLYAADFCVPFQNHYEAVTPAAVLSRYAITVDGQRIDGSRIKYLTQSADLAKEYREEIRRLKSCIETCRREIEILNAANGSGRNSDALIQTLAKIKMGLNLAASSVGGPQPFSTEFHYEGRSTNTVVIPTDPALASRGHGASIMYFAPAVLPGCTHLDFRAVMNCYSAEDNAIVIAVFQDGKNRPAAIVTEPLTPGVMTVLDRDFIVPLDGGPAAFEIRVGLAQPGGTLVLNHDPVRDLSPPFASYVRVRAALPAQP